MSLTLGDDHSCALFQNGALKCWGDNRHGQIGPYPDSAIGDDPADLGKNLPTILTGVTEVAAGARHTCVLKDEAVQCWGDNTSKQLGPDAVGTSRSRPDAVELGGKVKSVCTGGTWSAALMSDQTVKVWGVERAANPDGALFPVPGFERTQQISCGAYWVCGLDDANQVLCLANSITGVPTTAVAVDRTAASSVHFDQLSVGGHAACMIGDSAAYCWGANFQGQLPLVESNLVQYSAARADGGGEPRWVSTEGGVTCFATKNGEARCWGIDYLEGALGQPELTSQYPEGRNIGGFDGDQGSDLPAIKLGQGVKARSVVTSGYHTCALLEGRRIKCWGRNTSGQLGIGSTEPAVGDEVGEMGDELPFALVE